MEANIICPSWSVCVEIDGVEYVFLGGEDEGMGGKGTRGKRGCLESWFFVRRGEESDLVDDGVNELGGYGWGRHYFRGFAAFPCWR